MGIMALSSKSKAEIFAYVESIRDIEDVDTLYCEAMANMNEVGQFLPASISAGFSYVVAACCLRLEKEGRII